MFDMWKKIFVSGTQSKLGNATPLIRPTSIDEIIESLKNYKLNRKMEILDEIRFDDFKRQEVGEIEPQIGPDWRSVWYDQGCGQDHGSEEDLVEWHPVQSLIETMAWKVNESIIFHEVDSGDSVATFKAPKFTATWEILNIGPNNTSPQPQQPPIADPTKPDYFLFELGFVKWVSQHTWPRSSPISITFGFS